MTQSPSIVEVAEGLVRQLSDELTEPRPSECLCCYVARMVAEFDCDGSHRHALRYRDAMAPRATALLDRLSRVGACCCDCEMFLNGYMPKTGLLDEEDVAAGRAVLAPCAGVRRATLNPCANWMRIRRGW